MINNLEDKKTHLANLKARNNKHWNGSCNMRDLSCPVASQVVALPAQPLHQTDALHQAAAPEEGHQHVRGHLDLG